MKMTKEMFEKCVNKLGQAFAFLDEDVRELMTTIKTKGGLEKYGCDGWVSTDRPTKPNPSQIYRIRKDFCSQIDDGMIDNPVYEGLRKGVKTYDLLGGRLMLSEVVSCVDFVGVGYEKDDECLLRTSVDAAFGTPRFVRFRR